MPLDESTLAHWTRPASDTEQDRQARTERMVRQALALRPSLASARLHVYAKGSYPNNTNVRNDSDVDIAVECRDQYYWREDQPGFKPNNSPYRGGWTPGLLRVEVEAALVSAFPSQVDHAGNVAIRIRPSSARNNADVVPCFQFRRYTGPNNPISGIKIFRKDGGSIVNYPQQHYDQGVAKNQRTTQRYKFMVRIMKRAANLIRDAGHGDTPSFFVESMVFNCSDNAFAYSTWQQRVEAVLSEMATRLEADASGNQSYRCLEVNCCKLLFSDEQRWNYQTGRDFLNAASYLFLS